MHVPRERDLHDRTVPGLGGLAILVAAATAAIIFLPDGRRRGIVAGAVAIVAIGALDDAREGGLHPYLKLAGQCGWR